MAKNKRIDKTKDPKAEAGNKKLGFEHVPLSSFIALSKGMGPGAVKYGAKNWITAEGHQMNIYLNGIMRHLLLLMSGEDYVRDVDDRVHHLDAIISGASVLKDVISTGKCVDDRIKYTDDQIDVFARDICGDDYTKNKIKR